MLCEEVGEVAAAGDVHGEVPFVVCAGAGLEEGGRDEGFEDEESAEVYAARRAQVVSVYHDVRGDVERTR